MFFAKTDVAGVGHPASDYSCPHFRLHPIPARQVSVAGRSDIWFGGASVLASRLVGSPAPPVHFAGGVFTAAFILANWLAHLLPAEQIVCGMSLPDDIPKLRMAPPESAEDIARRVEHERRVVNREREFGLEQSLAPFRVGSVEYLNAVPLTHGIEDQIVFATPARLAELLRRDELDAALVSITEVLLNDRYDILDGIAIASLGEVFSVLLAHKKPLEEAKEIFCDTASLTSVNLLKVLLAERGLKPEFKPLENYKAAPEKDFVLLIGDRAIDFQRAPHQHEILDLGAAWFEATNLPFVYAVWALRRGAENKALRRLLRETKNFGMETLDVIIRNHPAYDLAFREDYLGWLIHFHLGSDEKRGIAKFCELLRKHGFGPVFEPKFVS
ncbi:MAG: menaquinone biosynthesis protein [Verrucomicrobiota bacterium]